MTHGLRSIAFVAELVHPPMRHEPKALQAIHAEAFGSAACHYKDFRMIPGGAQLSNNVGGLPGTPVSLANVLADRIQIREEQTGLSKDDFAERVRVFSQHALESLSLRLFLVQQFAVRSVVNPHVTAGSLPFVLSSIMGQDEHLLGAFPCEPNLAGLRFSFPPTGEAQGVYNVRIESYAQDARSLFIENVGTFGRPLLSDGLNELDVRFGATYDFLQETVVGYVSQFDGDDAS